MADQDATSWIGSADIFDGACIDAGFMRRVEAAGIGARAVEDRLPPHRALHESFRLALGDAVAREATVPSDAAIDVAHVALPAAETDPVLAPLVSLAIDQQACTGSTSAFEILAVGAAASPMPAVATIGFEWRGGRLRSIRKAALGGRAIVELALLLVPPPRGSRGERLASNGMVDTRPDRSGNAAQERCAPQGCAPGPRGKCH